MALQFRTDQIANDAITADKLELDTGTYAFASGATLTWAGTTTNANDLANKSYVDSVAAGLHWKDSVRASTTAAGTLATSFENGDVIDGVTLATGDRILLKDQTDAAENGIYIVAASGAPSRSSDMDVGSEFPGAAMFVKEGSINADSGWTCTNDVAPTVGSTAIAFVQFTGAGQIVAGDGLTKSGNTLSVVVDDTSIEINADTLRIKALGVTNAMLAGSIADSKLSAITTANKVESTALQLKSGGALESTGTGLQIASTAVTNDMLAGSIADSKLATITTADKVSGSAVQLNSNGSALEDSTGLRLKAATAGDGLAISGAQVMSVNVDDSSIQINSDILRVKALGVTDGMLAGSISNAKLSNSSITVGDGVSSTAIALGGSITFDAINFVEASGTISIKTAGVPLAALGVTPSMEVATGNGSTTAFALVNDVTVAAWLDKVMVFRNGQFCKKVASGAADSSEYTIASASGVTTVTFGVAPLTDEAIIFNYMY